MRSMTLRTKLPLRVRLGLKSLNIFQKGLLRAGTNTWQSKNPRMWLLRGHRSTRLPAPNP